MSNKNRMFTREQWGKNSFARGLITLLVFCLTGCGGGKSGWNVFSRKKSSQHYVDMALESRNADDRRAGVDGFAESSDAREEWAVKVFDTIARTDSDAMVRCAALRALTQSPDVERIPTCVRILATTTTQPSTEVRAAPARVRVSAGRLLLEVLDHNVLEDSQRERVLTVVLEQLEVEEDENARLSLIDILGYFQDLRAVDALVKQLDDTNFSVQHAAEISLVSLTGVTHQHNPHAWREWLEKTSDPFASAGEIPEEMQANREKARSGWFDW